MDKEVAQKLEQFRQEVAKTGEYVVFHTFPSKILELQELITASASPSSPFHFSHASSSSDTTVYPPPSPTSLDERESKKRKLSPTPNATEASSISSSVGNDIQNARLPSLVLGNKHMMALHETVKRESEQLASYVDEVKLWVTLTMPTIEDGDNFGVQIQEEVLAELHRAQESAYNVRDITRQDHLARAKICSKLIKYPHVEDYTLALKEHDEKQIYFARQHLRDLRNIYATLTDLIHKNISKIRTPKANNRVGLY